MTKKTEKTAKANKSKAAKPNVVEISVERERPDEEPDHNYTWTLRNRMREALLKHRVEKRIVWEEYRNDICEKLNIEPQASGLHSNDPRHWIWYGHDPSNLRLNRYAAYLKKEYPDFDFTAGYEQDYLKFALSLSSFSLSKKEINDIEKSRFAKMQAGRVFISRAGEEMNDETIDRDFDILNFRGLSDSPFLSFLMFRTSVIKGMKFANVSASYIDDPGFHSEFNVKVYKDRPILKKIKNLRFGILWPARQLGEYHGIMRDEVYNASHVLARFDKALGEPIKMLENPYLNTKEISFLEENLLAANFDILRFAKKDGLRELFEKIGEPPL